MSRTVGSEHVESAASLVDQAAQYRRELVVYCYRMLGSGVEAEDAVQETLLRAWRKARRFEGRSSLRSWLYRIATNVCIDMQRAPQRRALPIDLGTRRRPAGHARGCVGRDRLDRADPRFAGAARLRRSCRHGGAARLDPARLRGGAAAPAAAPAGGAGPARRARWSAGRGRGVARHHGRAGTAHCRGPARRSTPRRVAPGVRSTTTTAALLERYVAAFERYDVSALVSLVHEDATFMMPPYAFWLRGRNEIERRYAGPGQVCRDARLLTTRANGGPAVAVYHPTGHDRWEPFAIHLLEIRDDRLGGIMQFIDASLFAQFDLPAAISSDRRRA